MKHFNYNIDQGVICGSENNPDLFIRKTNFSVGHSESNFYHHLNTYEAYLILKGKLTFATAENEIDAAQGSIIYFEEAEPHKIIKVEEDCEMLLIKKVGSVKVEK